MSEYIVDFGSPAMLSRVIESESDRLKGFVVRCRDCKYAMAYAKAAYCDYMNRVVGLDGFCAWGERRDA